jgi:hypothetical protein
MTAIFGVDGKDNSIRLAERYEIPIISEAKLVELLNELSAGH